MYYRKSKSKSFFKIKPSKTMELIFNFQLFLVIKIFITIFFAVLFLQSGFNKVLDFKGNLAYVKSVLAKTYLNAVSPILFFLITILEIFAGIFCTIGAFLLVKNEQENFAIFGLELSTLSLLCLFLGQRVAKDYAGASTLVSYFLLVIFGLFSFTLKG
jgi:putative oxidoreductase